MSGFPGTSYPEDLAAQRALFQPLVETLVTNLLGAGVTFELHPCRGMPRNGSLPPCEVSIYFNEILVNLFLYWWWCVSYLPFRWTWRHWPLQHASDLREQGFLEQSRMAMLGFISTPLWPSPLVSESRYWKHYQIGWPVANSWPMQHSMVRAQSYQLDLAVDFPDVESVCTLPLPLRNTDTCWKTNTSRRLIHEPRCFFPVEDKKLNFVGRFFKNNSIF